MKVYTAHKIWPNIDYNKKQLRFFNKGVHYYVKKWCFKV